MRRRQASSLLVNPSAEKHAIRFWNQPELALRSWLVHNQALLAHRKRHPDACLLLSQEAQVHGANLIQQVNEQFGLTLDSEVDTGIDIKKVTMQKQITLPDVDTQLKDELESTWVQLQNAAVVSAPYHAQVQWQVVDDPSVWFHIGLLRQQQQPLSEAIDAFEHTVSIRANPDHYVVLIRACTQINEHDKAMTYCVEAMSQFSSDVRFISLYADLLCQQERWNEALQVCISHMEADKNTILLMQGFQILTKLGRGDEAQHLHNEATVKQIRNQQEYRQCGVGVLAESASSDSWQAVG